VWAPNKSLFAPQTLVAATSAFHFVVRPL